MSSFFLDYINWAPKQPDNPGKENCVETAPDPSHDGWYENWNNEVFKRNFSFFNKFVLGLQCHDAKLRL